MPKPLTYAQAGVDITANDRMVDLISDHVKKTHNPRVMHLHNAFAGLLRLDNNKKLFRKNYREPVLVTGTDGVGTKIKVAAAMKIYDTVGIDLVAMSVNDILVQGAEPLFFLDYVAVHKLIPEQIALFVKGVCDGCQLAGCALLGGETAEMPDVYRRGEFDLAGFAVGVVEKKRLITGDGVQKGDVVIGLPSSGLHSNGYALARRICFEKKRLKLDKTYPELGEPLGQTLLRPTRIYTRSVVSLLDYFKTKKVVKAMAHITGGGLVGNIPRVIPNNLDVVLQPKKWPVPPIFSFLQKKGPVAKDEMYRVFNMGIGFVLVVAPGYADAAMTQLKKAGETPMIIGQVKPGSNQVVLK